MEFATFFWVRKGVAFSALSTKFFGELVRGGGQISVPSWGDAENYFRWHPLLTICSGFGPFRGEPVKGDPQGVAFMGLQVATLLHHSTAAPLSPPKGAVPGPGLVGPRGQPSSNDVDVWNFARFHALLVLFMSAPMWCPSLRFVLGEY